VSEQAGTFMHELGHNLGLDHGGNEDKLYKPNYLSVMNYSFQLTGLRFNGANGLFDYSRFELPQLDETNLDERIGLSAGSIINGYGTSWFCGSEQNWENNANGSVNWNCNKTLGLFGKLIENRVSADINRDGNRDTLSSYNDWSNIKFKGGRIGGGVVLSEPLEIIVDELDIETARSFSPPAGSGLSGQHKNCTINLTWTAVGPLNDYSYKVYRSADGNSYSLLTVTNNANISDTNFDVAQTYSYYLTTVNALGSESIPSEFITVKGGVELVGDSIALVRSYNLEFGVQNSLLSKINQAREALSRGQASVACSIMQAFINDVNAQSGNKLTVIQANQLRAQANNIRAIVCCQ
jgi:hypothetical protein